MTRNPSVLDLFDLCVFLFVYGCSLVMNVQYIVPYMQQLLA